MPNANPNQPTNPQQRQSQQPTQQSKEEWGWRFEEDDTVNGPFPTREAAMENAKSQQSRRPDGKLIVGRTQKTGASVRLSDDAETIDRPDRQSTIDNGHGPIREIGLTFTPDHKKSHVTS